MKRINLLFVLIMTIVGMSSFKGDDKVYNVDRDKFVPTDFDTRNGVLLIQDFMIYNRQGKANGNFKKANDKMKAHMAEVYPYKYEFVDEKNLNDSKYADKDKYRYVIMWTNYVSAGQTKYNPSSGSFSTSSSSSSNSFHVYDRKNNKHYLTGGYPTAYAIKNFIPTINTIVKLLKELK